MSFRLQFPCEPSAPPLLWVMGGVTEDKGSDRWEGPGVLAQEAAAKEQDLSMIGWDVDALSARVPTVHFSRQELLREELILITGRRGCVGLAAARSPSWPALSTSFSPSTYLTSCAFANLVLGF